MAHRQRFDIQQEMHQYLVDNGIEAMLSSLVEALCTYQPKNVVQFSIDFLRDKYLILSPSGTTVTNALISGAAAAAQRRTALKKPRSSAAAAATAGSSKQQSGKKRQTKSSSSSVIADAGSEIAEEKAETYFGGFKFGAMPVSAHEDSQYDEDGAASASLADEDDEDQDATTAGAVEDTDEDQESDDGQTSQQDDGAATSGEEAEQQQQSTASSSQQKLKQFKMMAPTKQTRKAQPQIQSFKKKQEMDDEIDFNESENRRRRYSVSVPIRRGGLSAETMNESDLDTEQRMAIHEKLPEERKRLEAALSRATLFKQLDEDELQIINDSMVERKFKAGDFVMRQGDEGDYFYVVDSGECDIFVQPPNANLQPTKVQEVGPGGTFGELALMFGVPRAASVRARTDCRLWALDRMTFRKILMGQTLKKRQMYQEFLKNINILKTLNDYERLTIADALQPLTVSDGEIVVREGEQGDKFYIIVDGEVKVSRKLDGEDVELTRLHRSDYFGELALLFDQPRAATVSAVGPVRLVWLDRGSFKKLLGPCEDLLKRNMTIYTKYISNNI